MSDPQPEPTEAQKFRAFAQQIVNVPKAEIDRREEDYKRQRSEQKKQKKKAA